MQEAGLRRGLWGPPRGLPHSHPSPLTKQPGLWRKPAAAVGLWNHPPLPACCASPSSS